MPSKAQLRRNARHDALRAKMHEEEQEARRKWRASYTDAGLPIPCADGEPYVEEPLARAARARRLAIGKEYERICKLTIPNYTPITSGPWSEDDQALTAIEVGSIWHFTDNHDGKHYEIQLLAYDSKKPEWNSPYHIRVCDREYHLRDTWVGPGWFRKFAINFPQAKETECRTTSTTTSTETSSKPAPNANESSNTTTTTAQMLLPSNASPTKAPSKASSTSS